MKASLDSSLRPSKHLLKVIVEAERDIARGKFFGPFNSVDTMIADLEKNPIGQKLA